MAQSVSNDFGLIHTPARILLSGCSGSGKSVFVRRMIEHRHLIFNNQFDRIIYVLPKHSLASRKDFIDSLKEICIGLVVIEGYDEAMNSCNLNLDNSQKCIIFDDLGRDLISLGNS